MLKMKPSALAAGFLLLSACGHQNVTVSDTMLTPQITKGGELDGNRHPHVGLMVLQDATGAPQWRCTGTLLDSRHYLTAGHCTDGSEGGVHVEIWFDEGPILTDPTYLTAVRDGKSPAEACALVRQNDPAGSGYPCVGQASGTNYTHPEFYTASFVYHDLGLVVLDRDYVAAQYGKLPQLNAISDLAARVGVNRVTFTTVGYGLQESYPDAASWKNVAIKQRMVASPKLIQLHPEFMILSNNSSTGGTCFGDSGGPSFIGNSHVVGGVTSFGKTSTCAGKGGVYRVDRPDDLAWLATFGLRP